MKKNIKQHIKELFFLILGTAIYSLAVHVFVAPNQIAPGGMTGIAITINYLINIPIGLIYLIFNIPILILGYIKLGKGFIIKTIIAVVLTTVLLDYGYQFVPIYQGEKLLAALYGGVLEGVGLALAFIAGGSTGGTDVTNRVIQNKYPHVKIGTLIFTTDVVIVGIAMLVFKTLDTALYALIAMFAAKTIIDNLIYGLNKAKLLFIVSDYASKIVEIITSEISRSCTVLKGVGGYTKSEKNTIMCAVKPSEFYELKSIVNEIDPNAFIILSDANEVFGEGFTNVVKKQGKYF